jgi:hypothetical protein
VPSEGCFGNSYSFFGWRILAPPAEQICDLLELRRNRKRSGTMTPEEYSGFIATANMWQVGITRDVAFTRKIH